METFDRTTEKFSKERAMNEFMMEAIKEARKGINKGDGGPFGCVIVKDGTIIARAHNTVIKEQDSTCHAEINAIRKACKKLRTFDLFGCELYATGQPCEQCTGAIKWARIEKIYYGCTLDDNTSIGFRDRTTFEQELKSECIDRDECLLLFTDYLREHKANY